MPKLTYDQVRAYVLNNNHSGVSTEVVICMAWKESSFNSDEANPHSSALGLMQVTKGAVDEVNRNTPVGVHFEHGEMTDPARCIACATYYLALRIKEAGGDVKKGIEGYGTGRGYADNILRCKSCLKSSPATTRECLGVIHAIVPHDDESHRYRFGRTEFSHFIWIKDGALFTNPRLVEIEMINRGIYDLEVYNSADHLVSRGSRENSGWSTFDFAASMVPPVVSGQYKLKLINQDVGVRKVLQGVVSWQ